jgi:hypothetical protein
VANVDALYAAIPVEVLWRYGYLYGSWLL